MLAVLAAIAAIVIPQTGVLLGDRQVLRSGEQIRIEMTRLRVDAMRQGRVMMMQGMLEGNSVASSRSIHSPIRRRPWTRPVLKTLC